MLTAKQKEQLYKSGDLERPKEVKVVKPGKKKAPSAEAQQIKYLKSMSDNIAAAVNAISKSKTDPAGAQISMAISTLASEVKSLQEAERKIEVKIPRRERPKFYKVVRDEHNNLAGVQPVFEGQ